MEYLTFAEYEAYKLHPVKAEEFPQAVAMAQAVVDAYTFDVISKEKLMDDKAMAGRIKKATAFQIDLSARIGVEAIATSAGVIRQESESIGDYSHSVHYDHSTGCSVSVNGMQMSPVAASLLASIKALGRQVTIVC